MPIDSIAAVSSEWSIQPLGSIEAPERASGAGFGSILADQVKSLEATQNEAAKAATDLATGRATDPTAVVMSVERAQLAMQLASQVRTKGVEAIQQIFQTQV